MPSLGPLEGDPFIALFGSSLYYSGLTSAPETVLKMPDAAAVATTAEAAGCEA